MESDAHAFESSYRSALRSPTRLINEIVSISREYQAGLGRGLGMNATDLAVLEQVMMSGPLSPSELARRLTVSPGAMTTVVDRLVALGHVTRSEHPTDRRGVLVAATPESIARAVAQVLPAAIAVDRVLDDFTPAEQATIERYLARVSEVHRAELPA